MKPGATMRGALLLLGTALVPGCTSGDEPNDEAAIRFQLDAPLCSSQLPVEFRIDGTLVGTDTFRVHLAPDHILSRAYPVSPGEHLLAAAIPGGFVWPDTVVDVRPGHTFTRSLPFYCS
jgi:hypothetical protein